MRDAGNAEAPVAVALDELAAGGYGGRDVEGNGTYGAVSAAASPVSPSFPMPARLRFR